jgi:hypothetical protein
VNRAARTANAGLKRLYGVRGLDAANNIAKKSLIPDTVLPRVLLRDPAAYSDTDVPTAGRRRSQQEFRANGGPT